MSIQLHSQPRLPATNKKALEFEFHSADYHMLTEVASGLRNATEHLVTVLYDNCNIFEIPVLS